MSVKEKPDYLIDSSIRKAVTLCMVCKDVASGRHYGAIACNGCKGFFRRTIRRQHKYVCRFTINCTIEKHTRSVCRYCRYVQCIKAGMKVEAVQNERDAIGKRVRVPLVGENNNDNNNDNNNNNNNNNNAEQIDVTTSNHQDWETSVLDYLIWSEEQIDRLKESVILQTGNLEYSTRPSAHRTTLDGTPMATVNDVGIGIHSQLVLLRHWSQSLAPFAILKLDDQKALLKNFAAQHLVLSLAYRSTTSCDLLHLTNDTVIPRHSTDDIDFHCSDGDKILDELVAPMRFMQMDEKEFIALKACILFNPVAKGLSRESVMPILNTRRKIYTALEQHVKMNKAHEPTRLGDLIFFILSPLLAVANSIAQDVLIAKLSGMARMVELVDELILADNEHDSIDPDSSSQMNRSHLTSSIALTPASTAELPEVFNTDSQSDVTMFSGIAI